MVRVSPHAVSDVAADAVAPVVGPVVVAPDKFKGSLTARQVAEAVAAGLAEACPAVVVRRVPVADGGDGTVAAALAAGYRAVEVPAHGPTGQPITALIAVRGAAAVIEAASVAGLAVLQGGVRAPLAASSFGVGELLRAALDQGCRTVVLGVGGTACTDGGAGMIAALGGRLLPQYAPGGFLVMADPEGNEFCVIPSAPFELDDEGRASYLGDRGTALGPVLRTCP